MTWRILARKTYPPPPARRPCEGRTRWARRGGARPRARALEQPAGFFSANHRQSENHLSGTRPAAEPNRGGRMRVGRSPQRGPRPSGPGLRRRREHECFGSQPRDHAGRPSLRGRLPGRGRDRSPEAERPARHLGATHPPRIVREGGLAGAPLDGTGSRNVERDGPRSLRSPRDYPPEALDPGVVLKEWGARSLPIARSTRSAPTPIWNLEEAHRKELNCRHTMASTTKLISSHEIRYVRLCGLMIRPTQYEMNGTYQMYSRTGTPNRVHPQNCGAIDIAVATERIIMRFLPFRNRRASSGATRFLSSKLITCANAASITMSPVRSRVKREDAYGPMADASAGLSDGVESSTLFSKEGTIRTSKR